MLPNTLFYVLRGYATLQAPKTIEKADVLFFALHGFLLDHILVNRHFQAYPPSKQYQVSFWKWAIEWLEQAASDEARRDEIDERIYTYHIDLIQELSSQSLGTFAPSASYVTYLWPVDNPPERPVYPGYANATLLESRTTIESGTTGLRTWSASLILAQYLLQHTALVQERRVLELGCGVGFLGIVAASIQLDDPDASSSLWLTDVHEPVLERCEENTKLRCNRSRDHPDIQLRSLDWFDADDTERRPAVDALFNEARPDIILGADVVYDPSIIPPLVQILAVALTVRKAGTTPEAIIALTRRNEDTLADFVRQAEQRLQVETICTELAARNIFTNSAELGQPAHAQRVTIFRLQSKT
ncbi:putative methyltransferase-domain-containing protein [Trametes elegans]|nr:putative methyltransferase-domain-containing protein [Trametes elegans]